MMKRLLAICAIAVLSVSCVKKTTSADIPITAVPKLDSRAISLGKFFEHYKCPQPYYIDEYLTYADEYKLDYRLLPAISIAESSCGRHDCYHTNNWWGWASCKGISFKSVPFGIEFVDEKLANNHYYANKTNYQKLRAYNPNPEYAPRVIKLIEQIK